jgi:hypothetical protein
MSGNGTSDMTARFIARSDAWWMLIVSISTGSHAATPHATAARVIVLYSFSRSSAVTVFESQMRGM